ncbi:type III secretion system export apparatus subunit SctR [Pseudomonas sp. HK3]
MNNLPDPFFLILALSAMALVPFLAVMTTSFVKLAVVFGLLRNALGIQQIPPNMAIYGLAIILSIYIMAPVGYAIHDSLSDKEFSWENSDEFVEAIDDGSIPFKQFLKKHTSPKETDFFLKNAAALWPEEYAAKLTDDSFMVLIPAFTVSELTSAFEIGFLLYLPFIVIDLIISNILLALGMMMVSPMTISLPFKLLLFVLLDGWARLIHGLVLTYQ